MEPEQNAINRPPRESAARVHAQQLGWAVQERVLWRLGDAGRGLLEIVRWPFERVLWALQRRLIWPLQDRFADLGAGDRVAVAGGAALLLGILATGVLALAGAGGSGAETAQRVAVATPPAASAEPTPAPTPKPKREKAEPTLHGAPPSFEREAPPQVKAAQKEEAATAAGSKAGAETTTSTSSSAATAKISSDPTASASAATATSSRAGASAGEAESEAIPGRPAGPKAIAVARKFSRAFVVYETGGEESLVRKAFARTTTPALAKALLKRPPRLPADVKVPRAKVVTVVPGPSHDGIYTLSVSLLRVGATSELRLEMEKLKGEGWRVTNVLG